MSQPSLSTLRAFFAESFPHLPMELLGAEDGAVRGRLSVTEHDLRPGGTISGPTIMALVDAVTYMAVLSRIGIVPLAVTSSLSIVFLRRPAAGQAIEAHATLLKSGRKLAVAEVRVMSTGDDELVAHATVTYALPLDAPVLGEQAG